MNDPTKPTIKAIELHDGSDFALTIPADEQMRVCVAVPASARDDAACEGLTLDAIPSSSVSSLAIVRSGSDFFVVGIAKVDSPNNTAFEPSSSHEVAKGLLEEAKASLRGGQASLPGGADIAESSVVSSTMLTAEGVRAVHVSFDLSIADGVPHGMSVYAASAENAEYVVTWIVQSGSTQAMEALAAKTALTIHVAHPAQSRDARLGYAVGEIVGSLVLPFVVMATVVVIAWRVARRPPPAPAQPPR
jgi:hypothetical protein